MNSRFSGDQISRFSGDQISRRSDFSETRVRLECQTRFVGNQILRFCSDQIRRRSDFLRLVTQTFPSRLEVEAADVGTAFRRARSELPATRIGEQCTVRLALASGLSSAISSTSVWLPSVWLCSVVSLSVAGSDGEPALAAHCFSHAGWLCRLVCGLDHLPNVSPDQTAACPS